MNSVNKINNKIVIHSLKSGLVISVNRDKINPSHLALVKKIPLIPGTARQTHRYNFLVQ